MRLRVLAAATAAGMLLPLVAFAPPSSALSPRTGPAESAVRRLAPQKLQWKSCHKRHRTTNFPRYSRLECATLKAPLDWKKPNGKKITLSISRLKAREKAKGVLFTNPGGPGVPGWTLPLVFIDAGRERLLDQMDIIGIDVRGTGYSTQSSCRKTSGGVYDSRDRGKANVQAMLAQGKKRANACQKHGAKKLPSKYVTTAQTVYDLEWIRRNLTTSDGRKVKKIHWLGYSAGTWLGAHYARRWPKSTGRFVLDSVVDFSGSWQSFYDAQAKSFQARFGDFARWAAGYNEVYKLGGSRAAVLASYERIRAAAARKGRLEIERSGGVEYYAPDGIDHAVMTSLYSKYLFMDLAGLLQDLAAAAKSDAARRRPGAAPDPYAGQAPTFDDIVCNDTPNTRGPKALVKFTAKWGKKYPKEIQSWEEQLDTLLTFYKYPPQIKNAIYTSNPIERMNKEFRKRLKPMNSLTNIDAVEKIIYLDIMDYNERYANRVTTGFGQPGVKEKLVQMFEERYPTTATSVE